MTPDLGQLFGPPPDPDLQERMKAYQDAVRLAQQAERRQVTGQWAAVYCTCRMFPAADRHERQPAQAGCLVHGGFMITPHGEVI